MASPASASDHMPASAVMASYNAQKKKRKEEEEPAEDYEEGGYLPVLIGSCYKDRYVVVRKLGWGHFSTVWLVKDLEQNRHVALKVVKSAKNYYETARDEIILLQHVASVNSAHTGHGHLISYFDSFTLPSVYGNRQLHLSMAFEPLGPNLLTLLTDHKEQGTVTASGGLPSDLVRVISRQILLAMQYLHEECKLIHTDIKPENILVAIPDVEAVVKAELANSTGARSRVVGIPQSPNREYNPRRPPTVQIFESQPLPSPRYTSSLASMESLTRQMSTISSSSSASLATNSSNSSGSTAPTSCGSIRSSGKGKSRDSFVGGLLDTVVEVASPTQSNETSSVATASNKRLSLPGAGEIIASLPAPPPQAEPPAPPRSPPPIAGYCTSETFVVKVADLGNATPIVKHFTNDIQTRQYRAPEILLGHEDWDEQTDIWSVACVIFEMMTGDYLFDPKASGAAWNKDDDHLAQIMELLGDLEWEFKMGGRYSREIFNRKGHLRKIHSLRMWPIEEVLHDKYMLSRPAAKGFAEFLRPLLNPDPKRRATARKGLEHKWLYL